MKSQTKHFLKLVLKWIWVILTFGSLTLCSVIAYNFNITAFKNLGMFIVLKNACIAALVLGIAYFVGKIHPILCKGWMYRFNFKENLSLLPLKIKFINFLFGALLVFNLPALAMLEEIIFRNGTSTWLEGIWRSIIFGMVHCLLNVPLNGGVALSCLGLWFTYQYFEGGLALASMHHLTYNLLVFGLFVVSEIIKYKKKKNPK